jgi:hypothetical protein
MMRGCHLLTRPAFLRTDVRFAVAKKIVERAPFWHCRTICGRPRDADWPWARRLAGVPLVRRLREELKVNTTWRVQRLLRHANRRALTGFLAMAASHGMTSTIIDPLQTKTCTQSGANVLSSTDKHCKFWTNKFREMTAAPSKAAQAAEFRRTKIRSAESSTGSQAEEVPKGGIANCAW